MSWEGERDSILQLVLARIDQLGGNPGVQGRLSTEQAARWEAAARDEHAVALLDRIDRNLGRVADALEDLAAGARNRPKPEGRT